MVRRNLTVSAKALVLLSSIIVGANVLASITTFSPAFSTTTTTTSPAQDIDDSLFKGLEEFLAPSGYEQAREDPSYVINIPYSELGFSPFQPSEISIPANMTIIWFNEDESPHSVTFNETSPEVIDSELIDPQGGSFFHQFSTPGTYDYYDSQDPTSKGRINVGAQFQTGQNMDMLVGGDALPFEAGKVGRTTFSFVPNENVTTIPPSLSITYNVTISDSAGTALYSNQFEDSDGILDLELIPSSRSSSSNQTEPHFVTWGPDLTDQEGVASHGVYHIQGPVMTENEDYTITVAITSIDDQELSAPPSDLFVLPTLLNNVDTETAEADTSDSTETATTTTTTVAEDSDETNDDDDDDNNNNTGGERTTNRDGITVGGTSAADDYDETADDTGTTNDNNSNNNTPETNYDECDGITVGGTSAADDYGCPPDPDF